MDADQRDEIRVDGRPMRWPSIVVASAVILIAVVVWRNLEDAAASLNSVRAPVVAVDASATKPEPTARETPPIASVHLKQTRQTSTQPRSEPTAAIPQSAEPLWAETWVNVRERPGADETVLTVLNPGQKVLVVNPEHEWSAVYVDDQRLGYVWVRSLAKQPRGD